LAHGKLDMLRKFTGSFDIAQQSIGQINNLRAKLSALPQETSKSERMKTILNDFPAMSGIPGVEKISEIKNMIAMLKPLAAAKTASGQEPVNESERAEYNDLLEVVQLIEDKKDAK
jgi:hypothetical protein